MTWIKGLPEGSNDWDRLEKLMPEPFEAVTDLNRAIWDSSNDPVLLELLRLRMAQLLRCEVALKTINPLAVDSGLMGEKANAISDWPKSPLFTEKERRWLAFTEQWMGDVNGITDELFDPLLDYSTPEECNQIVFSLWPIEQTLRLAVMLDLDRSPEPNLLNEVFGIAALESEIRVNAGDRGLLGALPGVQGRKPVTTLSERARTARYKVGMMPRDPRTLEPAEHLKTVMYALGYVSPVTRELVRMRNGIIQDCHRCMSLRSELAVDAGLTDDMMEAVRDFQTDVRFSEAQKAALRFADAYLLHPWEVDESIKADIQKHFTNEEILELILRLYFNTINRTGRATGTDQDEIVVEVTNRF